MDNKKIKLITDISNNVNCNERIIQDAIESNYINLSVYLDKINFENDRDRDEVKNNIINLISFGHILGFNSAKEKCITIIAQSEDDQ